MAEAAGASTRASGHSRATARAIVSLSAGLRGNTRIVKPSLSYNTRSYAKNRRCHSRARTHHVRYLPDRVASTKARRQKGRRQEGRRPRHADHVRPRARAVAPVAELVAERISRCGREPERCAKI